LILAPDIPPRPSYPTPYHIPEFASVPYIHDPDFDEEDFLDDHVYETLESMPHESTMVLSHESMPRFYTSGDLEGIRKKKKNEWVSFPHYAIWVVPESPYRKPGKRERERQKRLQATAAEEAILRVQ
jgi:hypothetical protein